MKQHSLALLPPPPPPSPPITSRKQNSIRKCAYQLPQLHMQRPDAQMYLKSKLCRLLFPQASKHGCVIQNQTSSPKINSHYSPYPMLGSASQWVYCIPSQKGGDCPETNQRLGDWEGVCSIPTCAIMTDTHRQHCCCPDDQSHQHLRPTDVCPTLIISLTVVLYLNPS